MTLAEAVSRLVEGSIIHPGYADAYEKLPEETRVRIVREYLRLCDDELGVVMSSGPGDTRLKPDSLKIWNPNDRFWSRFKRAMDSVQGDAVGKNVPQTPTAQSTTADDAWSDNTWKRGLDNWLRNESKELDGLQPHGLTTDNYPYFMSDKMDPEDIAALADRAASDSYDVEMRTLQDGGDIMVLVPKDQSDEPLAAMDLDRKAHRSADKEEAGRLAGLGLAGALALGGCADVDDVSCPSSTHTSQPDDEEFNRWMLKYPELAKDKARMRRTWDLMRVTKSMRGLPKLGEDIAEAVIEDDDFQNALLIIQHHVDDIKGSDNKDYAVASADDIGELVSDLSKYLPKTLRKKLPSKKESYSLEDLAEVWKKATPKDRWFFIRDSLRDRGQSTRAAVQMADSCCNLSWEDVPANVKSILLANVGRG